MNASEIQPQNRVHTYELAAALGVVTITWVAMRPDSLLDGLTTTIVSIAGAALASTLVGAGYSHYADWR